MHLRARRTGCRRGARFLLSAGLILLGSHAALGAGVSWTHAPTGLPWKRIQATLRYGYRGVPVRAHILVSVVAGSGQYSVILRGGQAPVEQWSQRRALLAAIDQSVVITNPTQLGGVRHPQQTPVSSGDDGFDGYNDAWNRRQNHLDASRNAGQQATMGQDRRKDPRTGQIYDMPVRAYDPTLGGYRNPSSPTEILVPAAPGE